MGNKRQLVGIQNWQIFYVKKFVSSWVLKKSNFCYSRPTQVRRLLVLLKQRGNHPKIRQAVFLLPNDQTKSPHIPEYS